MLSKYSWYSYIVYTLALLGLYYVIVLLRYYRQELRQFFIRASSTKMASPPHQPSTFNSPQQVEALFMDAMTLSEQIKTVCQEVHFQEGDTDLLLYEIKKKVLLFPSLRQTPFMVAINNLIQTQITLYQFELADPHCIAALWAKD